MLKQFDIIIIGAGVNGLAAAWHLSRMTNASVAVLEQFEIDHKRGSSHGLSRMSRGTYADVDLIALMQMVVQQAWPELEQACGTKLFHAMPGCLFGPQGGVFDAYARAVLDAGADIELLDAVQAEKRFPMFDFSGLKALADHSAGLIDALKTMQALKHLAQQNGVVFMQNCPVLHIDYVNTPVKITTPAAMYQAQRVLVTGGAWTGRLIPQLATFLNVVRQTVGYFAVRSSARVLAQKMPVWAYLGENEGDIYYGLPEFNRAGLKAARHHTVAAEDDPDFQGSADAADLDVVLRLLQQRLKIPVSTLLDCETCLYTLTANHDFIIDVFPENPNIVIGAGFSGHGFKFAPLTGRILAELLLTQTTTLDVFNRMRSKFAWPEM